MTRPALRNAAFFAAIVVTAFALGAALAHALELPNKMQMTREQYFVMQRAYDGWNRLAVVLAAELAAMLALVLLYRREMRVLRPVLAAIGFLLAAQAVFWLWTFPANEATAQWTLQPANWEALRYQWEYSHLAGAGFQLLTLCALVIAVLRRSG